MKPVFTWKNQVIASSQMSLGNPDRPGNLTGCRRTWLLPLGFGPALLLTEFRLAAADGYQFQSLIVKVAQSYPFVTRHGAALGPAGAHDVSGDSSGTAPRKAGAD